MDASFFSVNLEETVMRGRERMAGTSHTTRLSARFCQGVLIYQVAAGCTYVTESCYLDKFRQARPEGAKKTLRSCFSTGMECTSRHVLKTP
ncbi:hypothetical protein CY34DRAFT_487019 [Suillus luteus UH-Slu-Lm8-n1]|uniref:Uncharacterized protein n=1 Tax=Suillus luteus UH-Slu-Lm8-n1 TaxID=930992 RepID=A0A0D0A6U5_9AGAM|nr:hypothetical protein CY34DRAFT_487019 [Suillus luteus UH-Slu-Lm8-n1]